MKNILVVTGWFPSEEEPMNGNFVKDQIEILQKEWGDKVKFTVMVVSYPTDIKSRVLKNRSTTFRPFGNPEIKVFHDQPYIVSHKLDLGVSKAIKDSVISTYNKIISEVGEPDFIWAVTLSGAFATVAINEKSTKKIPFILQEHSNKLTMHIKNCWQKEQLTKLRNEKFEILPVAKRQVDQFRNQGFTQDIEVVPNPVSNLFFNSAITKSADKSLNILCVGRLSDIKDPLLQVNTAAALQSSGVDFTWNFIGDGEMRQEVENAIKVVKLSNFILHGLKTKEEIIKALKKADVFVLTSKSENCPVALIEAQAMGVPCVVVENNASEYVVLEGNGLAVSNNPVQLADAIKEFSQDKVSESESIRARAYKVFSPEKFAEKLAFYMLSNQSITS